MACKICGSEWHTTEKCPKRGEEGVEPDEQIKPSVVKAREPDDAPELPEYAEAARCHRLAGGG